MNSKKHIFSTRNVFKKGLVGLFDVACSCRLTIYNFSICGPIYACTRARLCLCVPCVIVSIHKTSRIEKTIKI